MTDRRSAIRDSELPEHEAERLMAAAMGATLTEMRLASAIDEPSRVRFDDFVRRRRSGEPIQYIEGSVPFGSVEIAVDERVLIPRPETEEILQDTIAAIPPPATVVDLCTGSGNIAVALKHAYPEAAVYATDLSADACRVAEANAAQAQVDVVILEGNLFDPLPEHVRGRVDLLISNPPYLSEAEYSLVSEDVLREPRGALVAGPSGFEILAAIASEAHEWLAPGGTIVCEIGSTQAEAACELFAAYRPLIRKDMYGLDRSVVGTAPAE